MRKSELNYGHARALLSLKESKKIIAVYYTILKNNLSVRETEVLIKKLVTKKNKPTSSNVNSYRIDELENQLQNYLTSNVKIRATNNKGKIDILFDSLVELEDLIRKIIK